MYDSNLYYWCSSGIKNVQPRELYILWNLCNFAQVSYSVHFARVKQQNITHFLTLKRQCNAGSLLFFSCFFCRLLIFFSKSTILKSSFRNTISVSNRLKPDQAQQNVGPDLGPTVCKSYQQTTPAGKELTMAFGSQSSHAHKWILSPLALQETEPLHTTWRYSDRISL